jgi:hypothetical protein
MSYRGHTLVCDVTIVKQKRQACAAFLGVLAVSINVLRVCCIPTTILGVGTAGQQLEPEKAAAGDIAGERIFCESTSP